MHFRLLSVCLILIVSSCATQKSTLVDSGVLYFDASNGCLTMDIDRLEDVRESFGQYAKFAYMNGVKDLDDNILIDENIFTLSESATTIYAKINDIERERIKQKTAKAHNERE